MIDRQIFSISSPSLLNLFSISSQSLFDLLAISSQSLLNPWPSIVWAGLCMPWLRVGRQSERNNRQNCVKVTEFSFCDTTIWSSKGSLNTVEVPTVYTGDALFAYPIFVHVTCTSIAREVAGRGLTKALAEAAPQNKNKNKTNTNAETKLKRQIIEQSNEACNHDTSSVNLSFTCHKSQSQSSPSPFHPKSIPLLCSYLPHGVADPANVDWRPSCISETALAHMCCTCRHPAQTSVQFQLARGLTQNGQLLVDNLTDPHTCTSTARNAVG